MLMEYQNVVLYQIMAEQWNKNIDDKEKIIEDLERMQLSVFMIKFADLNKNQSVDFELDSVLEFWSSKKELIVNSEKPFVVADFYKQYEGYGDKDFIADSLQIQSSVNAPYASYGVFGLNQIPATFLEFPIANEKNQLVAYWLIMDYPLPPDISWPEIILVFAVILILGLTFVIIQTFLKPIDIMIRHVKGLKRGNLNSQIKISSKDELGELAKTINKMTLDINRLVNQKQNLLIDVSHELKTPLTRLKFIIANMKINDIQKNELNKEINFLQDMISNMLLSDKLSTPYIEDLEKKEVLLSVLIKNTCDMFYEIDKKLIIIDNTDKKQAIYIDKYKISLAIKNLIDNALKYGHKEKKNELILENFNKIIKITVQDYGTGISREQIEEIVKPLYRGQSAQEKSKTGFGLGLAITKKIIEAHNGNLKIESKINNGSKFIVTIPKGQI